MVGYDFDKLDYLCLGMAALLSNKQNTLFELLKWYPETSRLLEACVCIICYRKILLNQRGIIPANEIHKYMQSKETLIEMHSQRTLIFSVSEFTYPHYGGK